MDIDGKGSKVFGGGLVISLSKNHHKGGKKNEDKYSKLLKNACFFCRI